MDYKFYKVDKEQDIGYIYLNRPEKKNALNYTAFLELPQIISEMDSDDEIRVIIIGSSGDTFSSGIDLFDMSNEIEEIRNPDQKGHTKWTLIKKIRKLQDTVNCLQNTDKPTIAAVNGLCIGAGLDLISGCDIRLCSKDAKFSLKEASVGFVADMGVLQRLPLIIGEGNTRELAFTARFIDSETALRIHLVNEVFEDKSSLMAGARNIALEIASNSPIAVRATKRVLNFISEEQIKRGLDFVASISANIIPSEDLYEAINAFLEKRRPEF
ncbi:MAG: enoyl-CoA hydratase-related protein [Deltaproteobacteria bacterium]|nr:enoyl-CoA hydratase-related protein [Deltaproteobacteria bacterium]